MNFYDKKIGTPFMFRDCIIRVLKHFEGKRYVHLDLLFCMLKCLSCFKYMYSDLKLVHEHDILRFLVK
jgi:hypothetical protein